jgi:hypothetical protein
MVRISPNKDSEDSVLITENGEYGDIVVKVGMELKVFDMIYVFTGLVIIVSPSEPSITLKIKSDLATNRVVYNDNGEPTTENKTFYKNEEILLTNSQDSSDSSILATSITTPEKKERIIKKVSNKPKFPLTSDDDGGLLGKWENDKYVKNCHICQTEFGFITRKHHCRSCGKVICNNCSKNRYQNKRVCDTCFDKLSRQGTELSVLPNDTSIQDAGYKHRKNKSKRKNKRSLRRRRTSKRSNIHRKNKKVTKRLRKSRRRRARR